MDSELIAPTQSDPPDAIITKEIPIKVYETYIDDILTVLNITDTDDIKNLKAELNFSDTTKYELMAAFTNPEFTNKLTKLKEADKSIIELEAKYEDIFDDKDVKTLWNGLLQKLASLQVYIIIKSIRKSGEKCSEIVQAFSSALDKKMSFVNDILSQNIEEQMTPKKTETIKISSLKGGTNYISSYYKYIKYKNKYLKLKNIKINI